MLDVRQQEWKGEGEENEKVTVSNKDRERNLLWNGRNSSVGELPKKSEIKHNDMRLIDGSSAHGGKLRYTLPKCLENK